MSFVAPYSQRSRVILLLVVVQAVAAITVLSYFAMRLFSGAGDGTGVGLRQAMEVAFVIVLCLSVVHSVLAFRQMQGQLGQMRSRLRVASKSFQTLIDDEFNSWGLSPSEYDVALFILKGMSNAEIADITGKKIGTVKAHSNAVFRKSGLANRNQLSSYFLEVLLQEPLMDTTLNTALTESA